MWGKQKSNQSSWLLDLKNWCLNATRHALCIVWPRACPYDVLSLRPAACLANQANVALFTNTEWRKTSEPCSTDNHDTQPSKKQSMAGFCLQRHRWTSAAWTQCWMMVSGSDFRFFTSVTMCALVLTWKSNDVSGKWTNKRNTHTHLPTLASKCRCSYPTKHVISHLISQKDNSMLLCKETIDEANNNIPPCFLPHNISLWQTFLSLSLSLPHRHTLPAASTISLLSPHLQESAGCQSLFLAS